MKESLSVVHVSIKIEKFRDVVSDQKGRGLIKIFKLYNNIVSSDLTTVVWV